MCAKLVASLTRKFSIELTDGQWESAEASFSIEDETEFGFGHDGSTNAADALRAFVKAQVDAEMKRQREDVVGDGYAAQSVAEAFAEEVGAEVLGPEGQSIRRVEEHPPLPEEVHHTQVGNDEVREIVRTPLTDNQASFKVRWFEVAKTSNGDKYLKVYGKGKWKREWVPAWSDVAELLFDDIESMDVGEIHPPYPLEATVEMGEYKNPKSGKTSPSPQKVTEWTRVG